MDESSPRAEAAGPPPGGGRIANLIATLASDDRIKRERARAELTIIGKPAVPLLIETLKDPRTHVRWEAAKTLQEAPDPAAAPALVATLEDEDSGVRWLAAEALIALEREGIPALLAGLAQRSSSRWLREGAHHVLNELPLWKLVELLTPVMSALEHPSPQTGVPVAAAGALESLEELLRSRRKRSRDS